MARFAAAVSTLAATRDAAREVCRRVRAGVNAAPELAFVFASAHHQPEFAALAETMHAELGARCLLGCTGESIVCNKQELEEQPAVAVWAASLPGVTLVPMRLEFTSTPEGPVFVGWPDELPETWPAGSALVLLGEPFSFPADVLIAGLNDSQPGIPVIGGMASGGWQQGQNRLLLGSREIGTGAVGVLLSGPVWVQTVVSQGCRPIGKPFVVTKAERNVIFELGGRPPLAQLQEMFDTLSPEEQQLAREGLHVGQVIDEYRERFGRGDFLVRNVAGADRDSGAIAIGDWVRTGQTVQFHVRDAATADEDLNALLAAARQESEAFGGALLFTCNGRGTRLFDQPHHDASTLARYWNDLPTAGFFAQGEIGPIGRKNFLHGFTASIALFKAAG